MEDRELDQLLAEALQAEPLAGLEQRVLARLPSRKRAWWWWVPGLVAAGLAVIAVVVEMQPEESLPLRPPPVPLVVYLPRPPTHPPPARRRAKLEKQSQFPTPRPLSAEERALLAFLHQDPEGAGEALRDMRKRSEAPIEIEPIHIPPLLSEGESIKEKL